MVAGVSLALSPPRRGSQRRPDRSRPRWLRSWRRDDHLVTGAVQSERQVEQRVLGAHGGHDLVRATRDAASTGRVCGNGFAQLGGSRHRGVAMSASVDRDLGRVADMLRCVEIRLSDAEREDLASGRAQRRSARRHGERGARLNDLEALGERGRHGREGRAAPSRRSNDGERARSGANAIHRFKIASTIASAALSAAALSPLAALPQANPLFSKCRENTGLSCPGSVTLQSRTMLL